MWGLAVGSTGDEDGGGTGGESNGERARGGGEAGGEMGAAPAAGSASGEGGAARSASGAAVCLRGIATKPSAAFLDTRRKQMWIGRSNWTIMHAAL